jgi:hypothetical protein
MKNKEPWTCENHLWKLTIQNSMKPVNHNNYITKFLKKFDNQNASQNVN